MTNKDIALSYLKKGYSVIPVKSPQMVRTDLSTEEIIKQCKVPLIAWKEFQNRRPTEQEVVEWFEMWPEANIGIVTGKISNLVVFDLDSEDAVAYAEKQGGFPETAKGDKNAGDR